MLYGNRFPLDAPTPPGYIIGIGRGAKPLNFRMHGTSIGKRTRSDDDPTTTTPTTTTTPAPLPPPTTPLDAQLQKDCKSITMEEWAAIPDAVIRGTAKKKVGGQTATGMPLNAFQMQEMSNNAVVGEPGRDIGPMLSDVLHDIDDDVDHDGDLGSSGPLLGGAADQTTTITMQSHLQAAITRGEKITALTKQVKYWKILVQEEPDIAQNWLNLARLNQELCSYGEAEYADVKAVYEEGCEKLPWSEELWVAYVEWSQDVKIASRAVKVIPTSAALWIAYSKYSTNPEQILFEGVKLNQTNARLWEALVELNRNNDEVMLRMLRKATSLCTDASLSVSLAKIEPNPANARKVLMEALTHNPTSKEIFLMAARLEEQAGGVSKVPVVIAKALQVNPNLSRGDWYSIARSIAQEKTPSHPYTAAELTRQTMVLEPKPQDTKALKHLWIQEAQQYFLTSNNNSNNDLALVMYEKACEVLKEKKGLWVRYALLARSSSSSSPSSLLTTVLERGLAIHPKCVKLILMKAISLRVHSYQQAIEVLEKAAVDIPTSETIWLALCAAYDDEQNYEAVRRTFQRGCKALQLSTTSLGTILMSYVTFERRINPLGLRNAIVSISVNYAPAFRKNVFMRACELLCYFFQPPHHQPEHRSAVSAETMRSHYKTVLSELSHPTLFIIASRIEEELIHDVHRSRIVLDGGRKLHPNCPYLLTHYAKFEVNHQQTNHEAMKLLDAGIRTFRNRSLDALAEVLAVKIQAESVANRRITARNVLLMLKDPSLNCPNNGQHPRLSFQNALTFFEEDDKAEILSWCAASLKVNPKYGDAWALQYMASKYDPSVLTAFEKEMSGTLEIPIPTESVAVYGEHWLEVVQNPGFCGIRGYREVGGKEELFRSVIQCIKESVRNMAEGRCRYTAIWALPMT
eukprot:PhF_6_TR37573/c0_g1_i1/m.55710/K12855/PRPF6, PRP6; pre-mRNA-processing factor 6